MFGLATSALRLLCVTAFALCMTLGMLGNASATGLLGLASDDPCGDACPCEPADEVHAADDAHAGEQVDEHDHNPDAAALGAADTDCADDCPDCGSVRHALAGLPIAPVVLAYQAQARCGADATSPPQAPWLDDVSGVFRPPRAPLRSFAS